MDVSSKVNNNFPLRPKYFLTGHYVLKLFQQEIYSR
ncbi:hypothetical protein MCACPph1_CDS0007 [Moorella phage MCACPph1]